MSLRRTVTGAACVVAASMIAMFPTTNALGSATAEDSGSTTLSTYKGQASANAAYALLALPNFLIIENLFNGGGPTAQAALDSLGYSTGFASFPYPGDLGVAMPGLIGTLSGKPVPSYPFVATSQYPSAPDVSLDQPGYHLDSSAHEMAARSNAQAGARLAPSTDEAGTFAAASVVRDADNFTSHAESRLNTQVGVVAISGAISRAEVVVDEAGRITESSDFRVSSLSVNGVGVAVTQSGLQLIGSPQPVQKSMTVGTTTIRYVDAITTKDSVLAPGLQITTPLGVPAPVGRTVVTEFTIGRSFAQATGAAGPVLSAPAGALAPIPSAGGSPPTGPQPDGIAALPSPPASFGSVPTVPPAAAPPAAQAFEFANATSLKGSVPSLGIYPFVAAGALLFFLVSVGTRLIAGVRRTWN